jgi:hypothetical protein
VVPLRKLLFLVAAVLTALGLSGPAAQAAPPAGGDGLVSRAEWAADARARGVVLEPMVIDGCVETIMGRWGDTNKIDSVYVGNACDTHLYNGDVHAFNTWLYDEWKEGVDLPPGEGHVLPVGQYLPWGSLLCGEYWNWAGLWGRACETI